jgi:hypothetical protein
MNSSLRIGGDGNRSFARGLELLERPLDILERAGRYRDRWSGPAGE